MLVSTAADCRLIQNRINTLLHQMFDGMRECCTRLTPVFVRCRTWDYPSFELRLCQPGVLNANVFTLKILRAKLDRIVRNCNSQLAVHW